MNLAARFLGSVVRWALAGMGGAVLTWLVAKGMIDSELAKETLEWLTSSAASYIVTLVLTTVVPLLWSYRRALIEKLRFEAARRLPAGASPETVDAEIQKENLGKSPLQRLLPLLVLVMLAANVAAAARTNRALIAGRSTPTLALRVDPSTRPIHVLTLGMGCCISRPVAPAVGGWIEVALEGPRCAAGRVIELYPVRVSYVDPDLEIYRGTPGTWKCPGKRRSV